MKLLWLTNIPSPYRVDFFNELGKYCELTVLFEKSSSSERDDSWKQFSAENFKAVILKGKSVGVAEAFCPSVKNYLNTTDYDKIVVTNFATPTGMYAIHYMKRKGIPHIIEGDGAFAGSGKGLKERFKKYLLSNAELYLGTAEEHDKYYLTYGAAKEKIFRYPFSSIRERDVLSECVCDTEKTALKQALGMTESVALLAVGQFIPRKGYDVLIKAMAKTSKDVGCYIVGGEAPQEYCKLVEELGVQNVHFVGFTKKEALKRYYRAADFFVHPTREDIWGLVINEAMAQGLPVISTNRCIAALEMVKEGENGFIVSVEDVEGLAKRIEELAGNASMRNRMGTESLKIIRSYTIEEMAKRHMEVLCK
jgi:glycosyltransferase involved in cell wall biosynthesis